ncbi:MAG: HAMP domain-containing sensor histidine kinase [Bacteroidota bacterium]
MTKSAKFVVGLGLLVAIGILDYVTGPELSFSIFYLIPISFIAWTVGRKFGILASFLGATVWLLLELQMGPRYAVPAIAYWNALVRLGFFIIVALALSALRRSQERQEELGHFVVHDLQTPLTNLTAGIRTLDRLAGKKLSSDAKDLIEICLANCEQLTIITDSLLGLARIEAGKMPLQTAPASLKDLVNSSLDQVRTIAAHKKMQIVADLTEDADSVIADSTLTTRVLVNLVSNAIRYSNPGTLIVVQTKKYSETMASVSVTDQGPGISEEWKKKVFEKFSQIEARKSGSAVGSGLGLSFCRKAVETQGGSILLRSVVDEGTTVVFTLPLNIPNT